MSSRILRCRFSQGLGSNVPSCPLIFDIPLERREAEIDETYFFLEICCEILGESFQKNTKPFNLCSENTPCSHKKVVDVESRA